MFRGHDLLLPGLRSPCCPDGGGHGDHHRGEAALQDEPAPGEHRVQCRVQHRLRDRPERPGGAGRHPLDGCRQEGIRTRAGGGRQGDAQGPRALHPRPHMVGAF